MPWRISTRANKPQNAEVTLVARTVPSDSPRNGLNC
jgi:hypothetical protein